MNKLVRFALLLLAFMLSGTAFGQSNLPACRGSDWTSWTNCFGSWSDTNGEKYVGEWEHGYFHGEGTHTTADGGRYVGEFEIDGRNGRGTYTFPNGDKYVGEFESDLRNGQGTYTFAKGNRYVGEFKDDNFNGQGILYSVNGRIIESGIYKNDRLVTSQYINPNSFKRIASTSAEAALIEAQRLEAKRLKKQREQAAEEKRRFDAEKAQREFAAKGKEVASNYSDQKSVATSGGLNKEGSPNQFACWMPREAQEYQTIAGKLRIVCDPKVGWTDPKKAGGTDDEYRPSKMFLNGILINETLNYFGAEIVKRIGSFEYWMVPLGDGGNACEGWDLLAIGPSGHKLYDDLSDCKSWEYRQPMLTFAGLQVRDDTPAINPLCEPYLKVVPKRIKIRDAALVSKFFKYPHPKQQSRWLSKVPEKYRFSSAFPFSCQINDFDGVILVFETSETGLGFGLYLDQSEAFP